MTVTSSVRTRLLRTLAVGTGLAALVASGAAPAGAAVSHQQIQGSGSSWSANAVTQWIADVEPSGLRVVYSPSGSAVGRKDFANKTTDYAVSDIGYLGQDPITGEADTSLGRAFVYLPIVAGGTAFPYQIKVGGKRVTNLRLSGLTLAKIFTNRITNWNDPAITADNNGRRLPALTIIPVVHSEGSGSSAQFTKYLDTRYASVWRPFLGQAGSTEYFPRKGQAIAQSGSDGVMNFVASAAANGAIGYDEYSYALGKNYPVAKIENSAGYFNAPTQYNVAVALTKAQINFSHNDPTCPTGPANCYLLQKLENVYINPDTRTYPLSSYSYMIIPTAADDSKMTTAKRQTLADFLYYSLCQGQAEMGPIGYSPLPINLVQASFTQTSLLKTADPNVDLTARNVTTCHNPTFVAGQPTRNYLAEIAPKPPACDKAGAGPCTGNQGVTNGNPTNGKPPSSPSSAQATASAAATTAGSAAPSTSSSVDPLTGETTGSGTQAGGSDLGGTATEISSTGPGSTTGLLAGLAVAEILLILVLPPVLARKVWRRRDTGGPGSSS
jgi:phosphate ABC transporter phosphate-binding protein